MADDSRTDFGPLLRQAREQRGLSLQQVAATTKISARVLDALERNDPSKLPGGIFSRAFVRAYAKEVGLDPEETVTRFVAAFPPDVEDMTPTAARTVDAESFESGRRTAITVFQLVGLSILIIVVALVYMNLRPSTAAPEPPPAPVPAPSVSADPVARAAPAVTPAEASGLPSGPAGATQNPTGTTQTPGGAIQTAASGASSPTVPEATPAAAPAMAPTPDAPVALSVAADEDCWVSLTVDGTKVVARVLSAGERLQYRGRLMILSVGNAGGLSVAINGKPARALGARGQVVTTTLTAESVKALIQ
jgi:cytoskeletal protein RodZ